MSNDKRYNPIIYSRLAVLCGQQDWDGVVRYLQSLSHAGFRTAGYLLGERFLTEVAEEEYWTAFRRMVEFDTKALLGTLLKTAVNRLGQGTLSVRHPGFVALAEWLEAEDRKVDEHKILLYLIPALSADSDMEALFVRFHVNEPRRRMDYLLRGNSLPCYFLLFRTLRFLEHDKPLLTECCRFLMKKGDSLSFNMASLVKRYFDLPRVQGTFSLCIQPYEMARLEASFDTFAKVMSSM